jgi:hypothetical protein
VFEVGDIVSWTAKSKGISRNKQGTVIAIAEPCEEIIIPDKYKNIKRNTVRVNKFAVHVYLVMWIESVEAVTSRPKLFSH